MAEMGCVDTDGPLPPPAFTNNPPKNTIESESWKHRPPYERQSHEKVWPVKYRAVCQCRKISYVLKKDRPLDAKFCHCRGCQVMHGAPFQWAAIFHKEDVSFDHGASGLSFYSSALNSQEYSTPTKVSCAHCHTLIMDEGRNTCLLFPQLIEFEGSLDEQREQRDRFQPSCHIFYEQRIMDIPDGITKWSAMNERSKKLNDLGHEI
ncbi:hypothetical protein N7450_003567 [Penicillium hetheringtonii]|uniref:CENP-V/GFA domain-containing protein n=1 Tax=Penicillium hetheringtonii TaxID=911720 RepID=A0AAD6DZJ8_9EURO|nr:hypothetical protein N7450_003567 [Penicillium hetheringtonii]